MYILANVGFSWDELAEVYFKVRGYEISERALYLRVYREAKEMEHKFNPVEFINIAKAIIDKYKIEEKLTN